VKNDQQIDGNTNTWMLYYAVSLRLDENIYCHSFGRMSRRW